MTNERVETGIIQFGNDWPGVFIRGDAALMGFMPPLERASQGVILGAMDRIILGNLASLMQRADARLGNAMVLAHPSENLVLTDRLLAVEGHAIAAIHACLADRASVPPDLVEALDRLCSVVFGQTMDEAMEPPEEP